MSANSIERTAQPKPPKWPTKHILIIGLVAVAAVGLAVLSTKLLSFRDLSPVSGPLSGPPRHELPEFPWPPRSSAFTNIPSSYVTNPTRATALRDVATRLESALTKAGYGQFGYYSVPRGFALVTRLEQFKPNGMPADEPYRWSQQIPNPRIFSVDYLLTLIIGKSGHYRVIVFVVSADEFFSQKEGKTVNVEEADTLAIKGANQLPDSLASLPYTDAHWCAALIYEFEKSALDQPPEFKQNSSLLANVHLQRILPYLEKRP